LDRPEFDRTQLCLLEGLSNALDRQKFILTSNHGFTCV